MELSQRSPDSAQWDGAVIVALGGNLGDDDLSPEGILQAALDRFPAAGLYVRAGSGLWRSAAWPDPTQPPYVNAVALVDTVLAPGATLAALHAIETQFGRTRGRRNAARILDLDLIAHGRTVSAHGPILPHPRAAERRFVMGPLAEIAPDWTHPVLGLTARELCRQTTVGLDATPLRADRRSFEAATRGRPQAGG